MNIILAQPDGTDGRAADLEFRKGTVIIGRDAVECDISFEKARFPMVSRKHAELRIVNGQWTISDLGSTYGTFQNGQQVTQPQPVMAGSTLQFGTDGPKLVVVWFEVGDQAASAAPVQAEPSRQAPAQVQRQAPQRPPAPLVQIPHAKLEIPGPPAKPSLVIAKPTILLGREADCDVIFDAASGTVSRRHAEISFDGSNFVLRDNKSFNGTLVNAQKISSPTPLYDGDQIQLGLGGPILIFGSPGRAAPKGSSLAGQRSVSAFQSISVPAGAADSPKTMVANLGRAPSKPHVESSSEPQLLRSLQFGNKDVLKIGRDDSNDIRIDGLQIS